jgi:hypothetical protein
MAWLCTCLQKTSFFAILLFAFAAHADKGPEFKKSQIKIGGQVISVELAENDEQRAYGLMYRDHLDANSGMLFMFDYEMPLNFWMKNTFIDLSIGYFNKSRTLVDIKEMKKTSVMSVNPPTYPSKVPAKYALEMNKGWFTKHHIKVGAQFEFVNEPGQQSGSKKTPPVTK